MLVGANASAGFDDVVFDIGFASISHCSWLVDAIGLLDGLCRNHCRHRKRQQGQSRSDQAFALNNHGLSPSVARGLRQSLETVRDDGMIM